MSKEEKKPIDLQALYEGSPALRLAASVAMGMAAKKLGDEVGVKREEKRQPSLVSDPMGRLAREYFRPENMPPGAEKDYVRKCLARENQRSESPSSEVEPDSKL